MSFQHFFTIEGLSGTLVASESSIILQNSERVDEPGVPTVYSEGIITNDSDGANIECYINANNKPCILKPNENLEFGFTITDLKLINLSSEYPAEYRLFLKRRIEEFVPTTL